ncbi:hypothetical protein AVEN_160163-1 [Araneus ventricosus]|uniref:Uncharacterized protein n=1 Tax=Araneus ventricosus TaxID=182803 RepID=A0A4Y2NCJ1_ARAVE|nr:hypothetical protein AVEN_160163-1 [Araneus ventricosus]
MRVPAWGEKNNSRQALGEWQDINNYSTNDGLSVRGLRAIHSLTLKLRSRLRSSGFVKKLRIFIVPPGSGELAGQTVDIAFFFQNEFFSPSLFE